MNAKDKKFIIGGLVVAIIIAILAPFLASSNPDGLESAAEKIVLVKETEPMFEAPMPDYAVPALGESPLGGVISIVLGTIIAFLAMVGLATTARWFKSGSNGT
ncbi:MAG: PDGLE domain-containing protein [Methanobacteriaceae archaeon]|jgi:cobalt/nickel transport protein|nr:PDGLE domain-containing protein [Methanobacteriaceae archaeon]MDO9627477.1 PDGLE domain-containing protein [Methanobacteriaceae archaeon]